MCRTRRVHKPDDWLCFIIVWRLWPFSLFLSWQILTSVEQAFLNSSGKIGKTCSSRANYLLTVVGTCQNIANSRFRRFKTPDDDVVTPVVERERSSDELVRLSRCRRLRCHVLPHRSRLRVERAAPARRDYACRISARHGVVQTVAGRTATFHTV